MSKVNVLGVHIDPVRVEDVLEKIDTAISGHGRALIAHVHITGLNQAYELDWLYKFLNQADLVTCDGMGVKLGGRMLGSDIPQRFTLSDWIWQLIELAQARHYTLFFLGNPPGSAEKAAARLQVTYPGLQVVGTAHGFFNKSPGNPESEAVLEQINQARPNILLVGFGMPVQEQWLKDNWGGIQANVAMTCGALFEYVAGDLKRGPAWMTDHYLEWLARLLISPRRYTRRYVRDNPLFLYRIFKQRFSGDIANFKPNNK